MSTPYTGIYPLIRGALQDAGSGNPAVYVFSDNRIKITLDWVIKTTEGYKVVSDSVEPNIFDADDNLTSDGKTICLRVAILILTKENRLLSYRTDAISITTRDGYLSLINELKTELDGCIIEGLPSGKDTIDSWYNQAEDIDDQISNLT